MTPRDGGAPPERRLKVLLSVRPYLGHLHPLIPLARAFTRAGHSVAVASAEDVAGAVTATGLTWFPAGFNPRDMQEIFPRDDPDYGRRVVKAKLEDLLDISLGEFRPDVIIREPTDLAPILAAEILGAVSVVYGVSRFIPLSSWEYLGADETITNLRKEYRLPEDPELDCFYRDLYVAVLPPFLEVQSPLPVPAVQHLRYIPWDGDTSGWEAEEPAGPEDRPTILMTLGTVYNDYTNLFRSFITALADEDLDVICTVGEDADPSLFSSVPSNVRLERYRPHSTILPRCQVTLCHGGFNTVMGSLIAGVPVICVPLGSDHQYNADLCTRKGYGLTFTEEEASPERIRHDVLRVLGEPSFANKVRALQQRLATRPGPMTTVHRIEKLAARKQSDHDLRLRS
jgi:UDP:flavonoid glycosyltransferase YjiC (YdhE family)